MSNMSDAIDNASTQITAAFNAATKASWEAGYRTGLETAITCAEGIRDLMTKIDIDETLVALETDSGSIMADAVHDQALRAGRAVERHETGPLAGAYALIGPECLP